MSKAAKVRSGCWVHVDKVHGVGTDHALHVGTKGHYVVIETSDRLIRESKHEELEDACARADEVAAILVKHGWGK